MAGEVLTENKKKGMGWTLLAVAATNRPGTRQQGNEIELVEIDGQKLVRVPIVRRAVIRNRGKLVKLDQTVFNEILANHKNRVWDSPPFLRVSHEEGTTRQPALGWFDEELGGMLIQEDEWLVGYAKPTGTDAEELIETKKWRYASADLHPDYVSNQVAVLETATFEYLTPQDIEEIEMTEKEKEAVTRLEAEKVDLEAKLTAADTKAAELEARIIQLEAGDDDNQEADVPDWVNDKFAQLEEANKALLVEAQRKEHIAILEKRVAMADALKAQLEGRRENGYQLPASIIELAYSLVLAQPVGEGDQAVSLEDGREPTVDELMDYLFEGVRQLTHAIPPMMRVEGQTPSVDVPMEFETGEFGLSPEKLRKMREEKAKAVHGVPENGDGGNE